MCLFFVNGYGDHRDLHELTPTFPTRRSSELDDLARPQRLARHHHLVAGGEDGDSRTPPHRHPGKVHGGDEADVADTQPAAGAGAGIAGGEVEAGRAHVVAGLAGFLHDNRTLARGAVTGLGVLLADADRKSTRLNSS